MPQNNWLFYATAGGALASVDNDRVAGRRPISDKQLALGLDRGRRRRGQAHPGLVGEGRIPLCRTAGQIVFQSGAERCFPSNQRVTSTTTSFASA